MLHDICKSLSAVAVSFGNNKEHEMDSKKYMENTVVINCGLRGLQSIYPVKYTASHHRTVN
jgi:hypothetical protein